MGVWLRLGAVLAVAHLAHSLTFEASTGLAKLRSKRELSSGLNSLAARHKRQTGTYEYTSVPGYTHYETSAGWEYEETPGGFEYVEYGGGYGYGYGAHYGGGGWKKKIKHGGKKKKKIMKKKKKKKMKKKKKIMKKKKKIIKTTTTTTTTTPAPKCPEPVNYEYIPIMEYVTQPRVESIPIVSEAVVPDYGYTGYGYGGYARPLGWQTGLNYLGSGTGSRRFYMMRRRDGLDGLGRMGLGELSGFLQNQLGLTGVRTLGGTWGSSGSYAPGTAASWNTGLSRAIHGTGSYGWGRRSSWQKNKKAKKT